MLDSVLIAFAIIILGYTVGSVKIINQGNEALVERLGRFHRKLNPGLNFIVPLLDSIVLEESTRERVFDIEPQEAITKDNVPLTVDAVVYWRILQLERTFYQVEDIEQAIKNLVVTTLRSTIGQMNMQQTFSSRGEINHELLHQLDDATATWGVKVTRVEVQKIEPSPEMLKSMEEERTAIIRKEALITEAEGRRQAQIAEAEGMVQSMEKLSKALQGQPNNREVLKYMMAQRYVEANLKLGESPNSKVVFMDPKAITEAMTDLIGSDNPNKD
jgi:regulator of protease activity HflC (stomatin/prohibitin superfamily)